MKKTNQRPGVGEKICYFMANIGNIPVMGLLSAFFMIFYTDVVGLDPAAIATLFLISKVMDGVSDPVMGFVLDKFPVTKLGKFRPMLILGTIICVINYILLWFGAVWIPIGKYVIVYVTYLLLGWTFDMMDISLNSLLPVMTAENSERNKLSLIKSFGYMIGAAVIGIVGPIIVSPGTLQSYYILIFGSMAATLVLSVAGAMGIKERVSFEGKAEEKYTLKEMVSFLRMKPIWVMFVTALLATVGSTVANGASSYFFTYIMGDLQLMSGVSVVSLVCTVVSMLISPFLANRAGKKKVLLLGLCIAIAGTAIRLLDPTSLSLIYAGTVIGGLGGGLTSPLIYGIQADNTMYVQYKTGKRVEAAIASLTSFITKVGQGVAGAIPGYVLAACGYVGTAVTQPESVSHGLIFCVLILPLILTVVAGLLFGTQYNLGKAEIDQIGKEIENRE